MTYDTEILESQDAIYDALFDPSDEAEAEDAFITADELDEILASEYA